MRVSTKKVRLAYCNLKEPVSIEGGDPKYGVTILIPKNDKENQQIMLDAMKAVYDEDKDDHLTKGKKVAKPDFDNIPNPVKDGDSDTDNPIFKGHYYINALSRFKPICGDADLNEVDPEVIYSGCYGRVSLNFYTYNSGGRRGIGASLCNVIKVEDGEPLSSRKTLKDDFA